MVRFIIRRLIAMIAVMFVISLLTFLIFEAIPNGDPARRLAGRLATANEIAFIRHEYGFDKPLPIQYVRLMLQYTGYSKFNGASSNYDGAGRSASDNNTLFLNVWAAY